MLDGIDLTVGPGQMLAIVGPSGSGKSTLASLVPRLYDVTDGSITLDGHDLRTLFQEELRARIGVVTQDPTCSRHGGRQPALRPSRGHRRRPG
ncbi:MAG: hypothetical protein CM1200mP26_01230 [Acidimicrobiales bacterium]|nr:MAG: hypothetical protein CM1200mP26_01230 [Acidimicrobiales bacterium]